MKSIFKRLQLHIHCVNHTLLEVRGSSLTNGEELFMIYLETLLFIYLRVFMIYLETFPVCLSETKIYVKTQTVGLSDLVLST